MAAVPSWSAARSGLLGDTGAADHAAQIDQFLGAHAITALYAGTKILTPAGTGAGGPDPANFWILHSDGFDYDQPFTMSGTVVGRVVLPLLPVGAGADMQVSLCPDSSGAPGTPITSVRIPAAWISAFAAVAAAPGPPSAVQLTAAGAGPLALPQYNTPLMGSSNAVAWSSPTASGASSAGNPSSLVSGSYFVQVGGTVSGNPVANVFTIGWSGDAILADAVPQPSLPQVTSSAAVAATADTLVCAGGLTTGTTATSNVYTAGWASGTGTVSAWSTQASLPQTLYSCSGAAWGQGVYVVGGITGAGAVQPTVYWAVIANGQLQTWNTGIPLPVPVADAFVAAVNGFLVVAGGYTNTGFSATTSAVYYAAINADNSLGPWQTGPSLPTAAGNVGNNLAVTSSGLTIVNGNNGVGTVNAVQHLQFGPTGPGAWQTVQGSGNADSGAFAVGDGQWRIFTIASNQYNWQDVFEVPRISVPLPATGLTNGATYHILITQAGGDAGDYLRMPVQFDAFPGNPTVQFRAHGAGSWTAFNAGYAIPMAVHDQTAGGQIWHTWEDAGARYTTLAWSATPDQALLGIAEAVSMPGPVLNSNPTFTAGTAPWTVAGGALTQSSTHVQGALPFSGLLTPTGSAATSSIESEQDAVSQGRTYVATAQLFSPVGYGSVALNINWYSSSHTLLSTTSGAVTALAANTWTQYSTAGTAPSAAVYGTIVAAQTGTPPGSALLYVSAATLQDTVGPPLASVAALGYGGTWPSSAAWPPLSIAQLF